MFDSECYCTTYIEKATRNAPPPRAASLQPNPWCGAAIARLALATLARPAQPEKKGGAWKGESADDSSSFFAPGLWYWEEHLNWKERGRREKENKSGQGTTTSDILANLEIPSRLSQDDIGDIDARELLLLPAPSLPLEWWTKQHDAWRDHG